MLVALIRLGKEAYGRAILTEIQERLEREVSAGAVYATLERLESQGLASSRSRQARHPRGPGQAVLRADRRGPPGAERRQVGERRLWRGLAWPLKAQS